MLWARLGSWRIVEVDGVATGDHVDVRAGLLQETCEVGRGGAGADDRDGAPTELAYPGVLRAVGDEFLRQIGEDGRDMAEVGDANGDDDAAGGD